MNPDFCPPPGTPQPNANGPGRFVEPGQNLSRNRENGAYPGKSDVYGRGASVETRAQGLVGAAPSDGPKGPRFAVGRPTTSALFVMKWLVGGLIK